MRNLIQFLLKHTYLLLLLVYLVVGFIMLFNYNPYHRSVYLGSSNSITGRIYTFSGNIQSYFNLQEINSELLVKNSELETQLLQLQQQMKSVQALKELSDSSQNFLLKKYEFISAKVINNSTSRLQNYITLNKGKLDGITPEMGVVDHNGIVGIVSSVSDHFAVVISILNPKLKISAKLNKTDYFGSVTWNGKHTQYGILEELPRHAPIKTGDTLVTSGYSSFFPEGIIIGYIQKVGELQNNGTSNITLRFSTHFDRLGYVRVIKNKMQKELREVENQDQQ